MLLSKIEFPRRHYPGVFRSLGTVPGLPADGVFQTEKRAWGWGAVGGFKEATNLWLHILNLEKE